MATVVEFNCATGIQTVREETAEEAALREVDRIAYEEEVAASEAVATAKAANKASGEAKLADLGLTADEIAALVG